MSRIPGRFLLTVGLLALGSLGALAAQPATPVAPGVQWTFTGSGFGTACGDARWHGRYAWRIARWTATAITVQVAPGATGTHRLVVYPPHERQPKTRKPLVVVPLDVRP